VSRFSCQLLRSSINLSVTATITETGIVGGRLNLVRPYHSVGIYSFPALATKGLTPTVRRISASMIPAYELKEHATARSLVALRS
jgi:hypothetical protein